MCVDPNASRLAYLYLSLRCPVNSPGGAYILGGQVIPRALSPNAKSVGLSIGPARVFPARRQMRNANYTVDCNDRGSPRGCCVFALRSGHVTLVKGLLNGRTRNGAATPRYCTPIVYTGSRLLTNRATATCSRCIYRTANPTCPILIASYNDYCRRDRCLKNKRPPTRRRFS